MTTYWEPSICLMFYSFITLDFQLLGRAAPRSKLIHRCMLLLINALPFLGLFLSNFCNLMLPSTFRLQTFNFLHVCISYIPSQSTNFYRALTIILLLFLAPLSLVPHLSFYVYFVLLPQPIIFLASLLDNDLFVRSSGVVDNLRITASQTHSINKSTTCLLHYPNVTQHKSCTS